MWCDIKCNNDIIYFPSELENLKTDANFDYLHIVYFNL